MLSWGREEEELPASPCCKQIIQIQTYTSRISQAAGGSSLDVVALVLLLLLMLLTVAFSDFVFTLCVRAQNSVFHDWLLSETIDFCHGDNTFHIYSFNKWSWYTLMTLKFIYLYSCWKNSLKVSWIIMNKVSKV